MTHSVLYSIAYTKHLVNFVKMPGKNSVKKISEKGAKEPCNEAHKCNIIIRLKNLTKKEIENMQKNVS